MGADIYLESVWKPFEESWTPAAHDPRPETFNEVKAAANAIFDEMRASGGYYRNGYNSGDVMWAIGLSWHGTVGPMLNEHDYLPVSRASELIEMIEARPLTREHVVAHVLGDMCNGHPVTEQTLRMIEAIKKPVTRDAPPRRQMPTQQEINDLIMFLNTNRDQLLTILRKSVELNEPLYCSL